MGAAGADPQFPIRVRLDQSGKNSQGGSKVVSCRSRACDSKFCTTVVVSRNELPWAFRRNPPIGGPRIRSLLESLYIFSLPISTTDYVKTLVKCLRP